MRLLVARHGATQHNLEARFTGQIDAPLSALGVRQAEALASRLLPLRLDAIISSDLSRARQTAEVIAAERSQSVELEPGLREISMGDWEGRAVSEVQREWPDLFARLECDPMGLTAAPHGETWAQFVARVDGVLTRCRERFAEGDVLWVAHGGVISALLIRALGLDYDRRRQFARGNASLFELVYNPSGVVIVRANDTAHLNQLRMEQEGEQFQAL